MLQIKTFVKDSETMDDQINAFLSTLKSEDVKDIDVRVGFAVIQYEVRDHWKGRLCSECKYLDDSGQADAVIGLCQECGGRRRFNNRACDRYRDVRE